MAEDTLAFASKHRLLDKRPCVTAHTPLHGFAPQLEVADLYQREYGADAQQIDALIAAEPALSERIDGALPYTFAQCQYAVQQEMAQTLEDVLSRRTRALLLDAGATLRAAPRVAALIASEVGHDASWVAAQLKEFNTLVRANYSLLI
jgi:glycerol-3-phosphate dehydrogenase